MKSILYCFVFFFSTSVAFSQNSQWLNFTSGNIINDIVDDDSDVWIATEGGLVRISKTTDEQSFYNKANTNLPTNYIKALSIDRNNCLWLIPQSGGLFKYDGENWQQINKANTRFPTNSFNDLAFDSDNNMWLATSDYGIIKFDGVAWKIFKQSLKTNHVKLIEVDKNDNVWAALDQSGITKFDGEAWTSFTTGNSEIPSDIVSSITVDSQNRLWIGANALVKLEDDNWTIYNPSNSDFRGKVTSISADQQNNIWIGTFGGMGVYKFDGNNWVNYSAFDSPLPGNSISFIYADDNGEIYIVARSTDGKNKLLKYNNISWATVKTSNSAMIQNDVSSIVIDRKNQKWIGSRGLIKFSDFTYSFYSPLNRSTEVEDLIHTLKLDSNDNLWIGIWGDGSVVKMENERFFSFKPAPGGGLTDIQIDKNDNVWIAYKSRVASGSVYGGGLAFYDGSNWSSFTKENSGLSTNNALSIAIDKDQRLWVASGSKGINRYDGLEWDIFYAEENVSYIAIDPTGNKWLVTNDSIFIYDGFSWNVIVKSGTPLAGHHIRTIAFQNSNITWFGTSLGGALKYNNDNWTVYTSSNSCLPSNKVSAIAIDTDGNKWFGTDKGLAVFNENGISLGVEQNNSVEKKFSLMQNYPNPFNPQTTISFDVNEQTKVQLKIFDVLGRQVSLLTNSVYLAGTHKLVFNASGLPSGVYFYQIQAGDYSEVRKMLLLE